MKELSSPRINAMKLPLLYDALGRAFPDQCLYSNFTSLWQLLKWKLVKCTIDFSSLGQSKILLYFVTLSHCFRGVRELL